MTDSLAGWVRRVVFHSGDFYVLDLHIEDPQELSGRCTARGNLYGLVSIGHGIPIRLVGRWRRHPKYGHQLAIQSWEPWATTSEGVGAFFQTCIEGVNWEVAAGLASIGPRAFQDVPGSLEAIRQGPNPPLESDALQRALLGWERALAARDLAGLLKLGGIGATEIQAAMVQFGMEAPRVIKSNPYRLMEVLHDFPRVDKLAVELGFKADAPERTQGAVLWALRESTLQGHLYLRRGDLGQVAEELFKRHSLLPLGGGSFDQAADTLVQQKAVTLEAGTGVYLPLCYDYERKSAKLLSSLLSPGNIEVDLQPFLEGYEKANRITLSEDQRRAVELLAKNRVLVLTGLPGTGKTTAVRALVKLFEEARVSFVLMAPTGIAAKRLSSVTGQDASTIHRALKYDGSKWGYGADNRYVVDAVIVDEMSMVDQELFYRLLSALRPDTILVLVGDDAQLPSVGPGNVLRELVACERVPSVRLTQIFRQAAKGEIVMNSHRINRGEMPVLPEGRSDSEFCFVRLSDEDRIVDLVVDMAERLKGRNANFQVLSPKYEGVVGVNYLNERLRDRLNPEGPKEWKQDGLHFRLGDRLMVVKNDYERGVYNGDMGKLVAIEDDALHVRIHGLNEHDLDMEVEFPSHLASDKLRLAYAVSVHKSQGSEFDTIILPIVRSQGRMLQRNLLYTAVTRARKRVWLIGEESAVQKAIQNNKVVKRNTVLAQAVAGVLTRDGN